ncbi:MAG: hypothetical protein Q9176_007193 [Flavoplaca citrina]
MNGLTPETNFIAQSRKLNGLFLRQGQVCNVQLDELKVHDTEDVDLSTAEIQPQNKQARANTDIAFIIYCFFEDLHRIQVFLKETWTKYQDGAPDLSTCATTTDLALDLVRRTEDDITSQAPMRLGGTRSYEAISVLIFYAESFKKGNDPYRMPKSDKSLKITPFEEFIYLSTTHILIKFEQISSFKIAYPMKEINKDRKAHAMDELSKRLYQVRREGEVSTWIDFGARVLLDIRDILGEHMPRAHREQVVAGLASIKTLDMSIQANGALTPKGLRWT